MASPLGIPFDSYEFRGSTSGQDVNIQLLFHQTVLRISSAGHVWVSPTAPNVCTSCFNDWNSIALQTHWRECVVYFTGRLCVHQSSPARQSGFLFPATLVSRQSSSLCSQLSGRSLGAASGLSQLSRHRWEQSHVIADSLQLSQRAGRAGSSPSLCSSMNATIHSNIGMQGGNLYLCNYRWCIQFIQHGNAWKTCTFCECQWCVRSICIWSTHLPWK